MNEKRYAIVRVDKDYYLNSCPVGFENINNDFICAYRKDKVLNQYVHNCKNCRYGDTKEQLIKKVQTALQLCDKNRVEKCNQFYLVAKEIVEFLGVE